MKTTLTAQEFNEEIKDLIFVDFNDMNDDSYKEFEFAGYYHELYISKGVYTVSLEEISLTDKQQKVLIERLQEEVQELEDELLPADDMMSDLEFYSYVGVPN